MYSWLSKGHMFKTTAEVLAAEPSDSNGSVNFAEYFIMQGHKKGKEV